MSPPSFEEYSEAQVEALPSVSSDLGSLPQQIFEVIFIRWMGTINCLLSQPHLKIWYVFIILVIINVGCLPDMSTEQTVVVIVTIAVAIWIVLLVWNMLVSFIVIQNEGCVNLCHVEKDNLYERQRPSAHTKSTSNAIIKLSTVSCHPLWLDVYILSGIFWYQ